MEKVQKHLDGQADKAVEQATDRMLKIERAGRIVAKRVAKNKAAIKAVVAEAPKEVAEAIVQEAPKEVARAIVQEAPEEVTRAVVRKNAAGVTTAGLIALGYSREEAEAIVNKKKKP